MKYILPLTAIAEMATGLALIAMPSLIGRLLLGVPLTEPATMVASILGVALLALGIACWPGPPRLGMTVYSALITLYLAYTGFSSASAGPLLWPIAALHGGLTIALLPSWNRSQRGGA